jgi:hypothetical protein
MPTTFGHYAKLFCNMVSGPCNISRLCLRLAVLPPFPMRIGGLRCWSATGLSWLIQISCSNAFKIKGTVSGCGKSFRLVRLPMWTTRPGEREDDRARGRCQRWCPNDNPGIKVLFWRRVGHFTSL